MRSARSQSAMEYLMTYGWAILIIAVVLGALYSLGVFNAVNFMPKVPGGGCHVFRPNGPGTSWNVNLVGSCNNALPQYVAQFNGQSSRISVPTTGLPLTGARSAFAWIFYTGPSSGTSYNYFSIFSYGMNGPPAGVLSDLAVDFTTGGVKVGFGGWSDDFYMLPLTPVTWTFVGYSYVGDASNTITIYANGQSLSTHLPTSLDTVLGSAFIGTRGGAANQPFNGSIANVQIYNTSLTANQVAYLYNEGIGGMPISPQYLVGWWPLNGDTNDYSGNNNNGAPTSIAFNGTWTGGYNVP